MKNNRILITGAAGFIGFHLSEKLIKLGYKLTLIDNFSRGKKDKSFLNLTKKKITFFNHDLKKKINIKNNYNYIFHCAAKIGVKNISKAPYESIETNLISTLNVINFVKNSKKKTKLIFFSTSEVYSPLIKNNKIRFPIKENTDLIIPHKIIKRDSYYLSKLICEKILQISNINYLILRPHNIYGPRMGSAHVIPELIKKIIGPNNNYKVFSPFHKRAFCYIDDAVDQIIKISLKKFNNNKIFNIGNPKSEITMIKLAKKIQKKIKIKKKIKLGPVTIGSPKRRIPSIKLIEKEINLQKFTNLDNGLKKTIEWYQKN